MVEGIRKPLRALQLLSPKSHHGNSAGMKSWTLTKRIVYQSEILQFQIVELSQIKEKKKPTIFWHTEATHQEFVETFLKPLWAELLCSCPHVAVGAAVTLNCSRQWFFCDPECRYSCTKLWGIDCSLAKSCPHYERSCESKDHFVGLRCSIGRMNRITSRWCSYILTSLRLLPLRLDLGLCSITYRALSYSINLYTTLSVKLLQLALLFLLPAHRLYPLFCRAHRQIQHDLDSENRFMVCCPMEFVVLPCLLPLEFGLLICQLVTTWISKSPYDT